MYVYIVKVVYCLVYFFILEGVYKLMLCVKLVNMCKSCV